MTDAFVVHRLRAKPVEYIVRIQHFGSGGEWTMAVGVEGVTEDDLNRARVVSDLRAAAEMIEHHEANEPHQQGHV